MVRFQSKNPDFLFKNPDLLIRNLDFLLKNGDFTIKQARVSAGAKSDDVNCGCADGRVDPGMKMMFAI